MLAGDAGVAVESAVEVGAVDTGAQMDSQTEARHSGGARASASDLADGSTIVLIDSRVEQLDVLMQHLPANSEIVLIDQSLDGIDQITAALARRTNIASVHLISHGCDGEIQFGRDVIDAALLNANRAAVGSWAGALTEQADILIYGCDVAAGTRGQTFVRTLAELTSADVAASSNMTGHRDRGGDWILESEFGSIESPLVLSQQAQSMYAATLPITIFAAGEMGDENIALQIDGNTVAQWSNIGGDYANGGFNAFNYDNDSPVSADRIRVVFTNDLYVEGVADRNVRVDRVVVDGVEFQTESPSVFSTGSWRDGIGIQPGNPESEFLHAGGYFQYNESARSSDHFLTIYAAGQTGTESMELLIDSEVVQRWDNVGGDLTSRNFGTFVYASDEPIDANRVRVRLVDGSMSPGADKNLVVDKIMIDGVAHEAEASDVISTGTWKANDGVVSGYRNSEWLHATGFFQFDANTRTYDGSGNQIDFDDWGVAGTQLLRAADARYADGISDPIVEAIPSAREISNQLVAQTPGSFGNPEALSAMVHVWGQFMDHDLSLTEPPSTGGEAMPIAVPIGDAFFDPRSTGSAVIDLTRSEYAKGTGTSVTNPRQHDNHITAFMDASMVYGSSYEEAIALRELSGGRMLVSQGDLLPIGAEGNFLAGDIRAMENVNLLTMHTLFVREHNHWAERIGSASPQLTDEQIFQQARRIVTAEIQAITFNEFLPALLGSESIDAYAGYNATVNPGIATEFSTAAFRVGHTMLNDSVEFMDTYSNQVAAPMALADAFFNRELVEQLGIDSSLKFAASVQAQTIDGQIVDSLRNFLFGRPGSGGFDLASLNIQRGRDHGLSDYNTTREAYGLSRVNDFSEITSNVDMQNRLREVYGSVDQIDLWVGGLAEDSPAGRSIGDTFTAIIRDQFTRTRDGDRLWYENTFSADAIASINATRLSDIISRNTTVDTIQDDVFRVWGVVEGRVEATNNQPIAGMGVELYNGFGQLVAQTVSDGDGRYRFNQITRTGAYRVVLQGNGQYTDTGTGYQDVWFYEGNLVINNIDFDLVPTGSLA